MTDFDASPQLTLVKKWFDAYATLDMKNVEPIVSKDYQYQILPESMGLPTEEREENLQRVRKMFPMFRKFEVTYHEVIEAPGKVIVQSTRVFTTPRGETFDFNPVTIFTLAEEGGELKVLHCKEFGDPEGRRAIYSWVKKAAAERAS